MYLQDLQSILEFIESDVPRDDWVKILMGIKNEFGDDAYDIAEQWSSNASSFKKDSFRSTWSSIKAEGSVTIATVVKTATDNGYKPNTSEYSPEEKKRFAEERKKREIRKLEAAAAAKHEQDTWHNTISQFSQFILSNHTIPVKSNKYLTEKKVHSFGLNAFKSSIIIVMHNDYKTEVIVGAQDIKSFFNNLPNNDDRTFSFLHIKRGDLAVPLIDSDKKLWNLQVITANGTKLFIKHGKKSGCFHFIGKASDCNIIAVAEGYATAASIHMATQWPCVVALDAGNLKPVVCSLRDKLPSNDFIICADDDSGTPGNPGLTKAKEAAKLINARVAVADFSVLEKKAA